MKQVYQPITFENLPTNILFEGYYWYSNEKTPKIISQEPIQLSWFTVLPFVIEANFYAKKEQISIQVRFIDGSYHIAKIDLTQIGEIPYDEVEYIGHDVDGHNFMMIEAWDSQRDELLEGMETLVPAWSAFAGFTKKI